MDDTWEFEREKTYGSGHATVTIKCPYFRNHGKREIHCDSAYGSAAVCILRFRSEETKTMHLRVWCQKQYEKCEWYRVMAKLDDPEG